MDNYTATEMAYKNGFEKGFTSGEHEILRKILMFLEVQMMDSENCSCGHNTLSKFYNYCPYCGEKYNA